jgi:hypothetical protein
MLVTLRNRTAIRGISPALEAEFDALCGVISQTFIKEHTEQGAHAAGVFSIPVSIQTQLDALASAIAAIQQSSWVTVKKTTDESRTNDGGGGVGVVVDDGELKFAMAANTVYTIRATIFYELDEVSTGNLLKHRWSGPAAPTVVQGEQRVGGTAFSARVLDAFDAANQDAAAYTSAATNCRGVAHLVLLVQNGANAGTFSFQWVSGKATAASAIVRKGSFLEYIRQ